MSDIVDLPVTSVAGHTLQHPAYRCTAKDLWPNDIVELEAHYVHDLDRYLGDFCRPIRNIADEVSCVGCGAQLTAKTQATADKLGRTVDVDEQTGEGRCLKCAYPLRAVHMMYGSDGRLLVKLVGFPLLYHPNSTKRN